MLNEELLSIWLRVSSIIDNQRLAVGMPFNEAMVCNLVARAQRQGGCITASKLCAETHILKSQMNAILSSLERKGVLERRRSERDRRQVELRLSKEGWECFECSHRHSLELADRLIGGMGEDSVRVLLPLLSQAADIFEGRDREA